MHLRSILPAFSRRSLGRHLRRCSISGAASNTTARPLGTYSFLLSSLSVSISPHKLLKNIFLVTFCITKLRLPDNICSQINNSFTNTTLPIHRTRFVQSTNLEAPYYAGTHLKVSLMTLFFPYAFYQFCALHKTEAAGQHLFTDKQFLYRQHFT